MAGQSRFLSPPGGAGVDAVAGGGHQGVGADVHDKDHSFPIAALDAAAETSAPIGATTTTAKVRFAIILPQSIVLVEYYNMKLINL
jgi:hypothetical protein